MFMAIPTIDKMISRLVSYENDSSCSGYGPVCDVPHNDDSSHLLTKVWMVAAWRPVVPLTDGSSTLEDRRCCFSSSVSASSM